MSDPLVFAEVLDELGGVDGLGEELEGVAALAGAGEDFNRGRLSAEEDDAGVGTELADGDGGFDTVDLRHEDVGEDEVRAVARGLFDRLFAAVGSFGDEAVAVEDLNDGVGDDFFVIHDQDSGGRPLHFGFVAGGYREESERLFEALLLKSNEFITGVLNMGRA